MSIDWMYKRWALDCIVEVARSVSCDFVERYLNYRAVGTGSQLENLRSRTGNDPNWPDAAQRAAIFGPLLGPSDGKPVPREASRFHESAAAVREAAIRYSERVFDTGEPMLRQAFVDALHGFRAHLNTLTGGAAVGVGDRQTDSIFRAAVDVLRDPAVAQAFGLSRPMNKDWPLETENYDGTGAYLIEELTRLLAPQRTGNIKSSHFIVMQRVANRGKETIQQVLAYRGEPAAAQAEKAAAEAEEVAAEAEEAAAEAEEAAAEAEAEAKQAAAEAERAAAAEAEAEPAAADEAEAEPAAAREARRKAEEAAAARKRAERMRKLAKAKKAKADLYVGEVRRLIGTTYSWATALRDLAAGTQGRGS